MIAYNLKLSENQVKFICNQIKIWIVEESQPKIMNNP